MRLALAATVLLVIYIAACSWWPFAACLRCDGAGRKFSPSGRAWRRCPRCKGSGERLRVGRRLWNAWSGVRDRGTPR